MKLPRHGHGDGWTDSESQSHRSRSSNSRCNQPHLAVAGTIPQQHPTPIATQPLHFHKNLRDQKPLHKQKKTHTLTLTTFFQNHKSQKKEPKGMDIPSRPVWPPGPVHSGDGSDREPSLDRPYCSIARTRTGERSWLHRSRDGEWEGSSDQMGVPSHRESRERKWGGWIFLRGGSFLSLYLYKSRGRTRHPLSLSHSLSVSTQKSVLIILIFLYVCKGLLLLVSEFVGWFYLYLFICTRHDTNTSH